MKTTPDFMAPLENRIIDALSDTALQELFPEILSSESPNYYLGNALVQAAANGYTQSYKSTVHEVFKDAESHDGHIERAINSAICKRHAWIANDLVDHISSSPHPRRSNILQCALLHAIRENDISIYNRILSKEEFSTISYMTQLDVACTFGKAELVSLILKPLMTKTKGNEVQNSLEHPLEISIKKKFHSITAIVLVPYLKCAASWPYPETARKIIMKIDDEDYAKIPREESLILISAAIPTEAKRALLRRLGSNLETEPKDIQLSVDSQHFTAHKDILSFWSPYFAALFRREWADRDKVAFDQNIISAAALKAVIDFTYSGEYIHREPDISGEEKVAQLKVAADYLRIDALKQKIEEYFGSER
ncbi:hypothetical protein EIK77_000837 [Talaromyces pinophilus]|nr:hypothetical protein EIK77_000837 [Talaromyces pinophilus]PCG88227.1 BTB/POZ [Penicillium occitanis (nom. inval.)]PCG88281.1 hypothetical protein PENOC_111680 [Penicillium occitanis (nom. inval.)]